MPASVKYQKVHTYAKTGWPRYRVQVMDNGRYMSGTLYRAKAGIWIFKSKYMDDVNTQCYALNEAKAWLRAYLIKFMEEA